CWIDRILLVGRVKGRLYLRKAGQIRTLENQTQVRVGNQVPVLIYYVGVACLSEFHAQYYIPHRLQVDVSNRNGSLAVCQRYPHVRFGPALEVDVAEHDPPRLG